jgi:hypothetical protein
MAIVIYQTINAFILTSIVCIVYSLISVLWNIKVKLNVFINNEEAMQLAKNDNVNNDENNNIIV